MKREKLVLAEKNEDEIDFFFRFLSDFILQRKQKKVIEQGEILVKKYEIFAGVNGAGKSTLYATNHVVAGENRVNTDEILKNMGDWRDTALTPWFDISVLK